MQFIDRFIQKSGEHQERDQITDLHRTAQHVSRAHPNHQNNPERADEIHGGVINRPDPHHHERRVAELVADRVESGVLFALPHEALDLPDAGEIVVQEGVHRGGSAPLQAISPVRRQRVPKRAAGQKRQWRQPHEGQ